MTDKKTRKKNVRKAIKDRAILVGAKQSGVRRSIKLRDVTNFVDQEYGSRTGSGTYNANLYADGDLKPLDRIFHAWYDHKHKHRTMVWEHGLRIIAKPGLSDWKAWFAEMQVEFDAKRQEIANNWDGHSQGDKKRKGHGECGSAPPQISRLLFLTCCALQQSGARAAC